MSRSVLPKRIYVNGRFLAQTTTGVQRYAREALNSIDALLAAEGATRWIVLAPKGTTCHANWKNIEFRTVGSLSGHAWEQLELPWYASDGWLLTLCGAPSFFHHAQMFAIHDTAIYDMPNGYSFSYRAYYRVLYRLCVNRAKAIVTVSEFSKSRLASLFPKAAGRIVVTYAGAEHSVRATDVQSEHLAPVDLPQRPYVLAVSSLAPNKNFGMIIKLSQMLKNTDVCLAVVGQMNSRVFAKTKVSDSKISWLGYASDEELEQLYRHAACFAFPSLYEGFGLPPIEAMRFNCPVVASNAASIPEVCGDAALYFDPHSAEELRLQVMRVLNEPGVAEELKQRGRSRARTYTWSKVAGIILRTIGSLNEK